MNHRRRLVIAHGAVAPAAPFGSFARQQGRASGASASRIWRIGYLTLTNRAGGAATYAAMVQGLREPGYVEGDNLLIEARYADGDVKRLTALAAELVQLKVDLIVALANQPTGAAKAATSTIPIVMPNTNDPVGNGYIDSLGRPDGNVTGLSAVSFELAPKRIEMLLAMTATRAPKVSHVAVLEPSDNPVMRRQMGFLEEARSRRSMEALGSLCRRQNSAMRAPYCRSRQDAAVMAWAPQALASPNTVSRSIKARTLWNRVSKPRRRAPTRS